MLTPEDLQAIESLFNKRFDKMESRMDSMESRLDSMDKRLDSMDKRLSDLEENVTEIRSATNHLLGWADKVSVITKVAL